MCKLTFTINKLVNNSVHHAHFYVLFQECCQGLTEYFPGYSFALGCDLVYLHHFSHSPIRFENFLAGKLSAAPLFLLF